MKYFNFSLMGKRFKIIMFCVVLTLFLIRVIPDISKNDRCDAYDEFLLRSVNGVVFQKYIDSTQHSYKTIIIKNFEFGKIEKIIIDFYISELYNQINVNDTIYKEVHSDSVFKTNKGQKFLISKVDFGCNR